MRKLPFQALLAAFVVSAVTLTSLFPSGEGGGGKTDTNSLGANYMAPQVAKGNQSGYIVLLRLDRMDIERSLTSCGDIASANVCLQSYNAIASQLSPAYLRKNGLPTSMN